MISCFKKYGQLMHASVIFLLSFFAFSFCQIYIDSVQGNDNTGTGSEPNPFASFAAAGITWGPQSTTVYIKRGSVLGGASITNPFVSIVIDTYGDGNNPVINSPFAVSAQQSSTILFEEIAFHSSVTIDSQNPNDRTTVTFQDCLFRNGAPGASALTITNSIASIRSSNFTSISTAQNGGAIFAQNSNIEVRNSFFTDCTAQDNGGAIYLISSTANIRDSFFTSTTALSSGPQSFPEEPILSQTLQGGGAIYAEVSTVTINVNTFTSTSSRAHGGAISCISSVCDIIRPTVTRSTSVLNGGAIFVSSYVPAVTQTLKTVSVSQGSFTECSGKEGGIMYSYHGYVTLTSNTYANSRTTNGGGGAIKAVSISTLLPAARFTENSGSFINNTASKISLSNSIVAAGGAINIEDIDANIINVSFERNRADKGAAMSVRNAVGIGQVRVIDGRFRRNFAIEAASLHMAVATNFFVSNANFEYNQCQTQGGAFSAEEVSTGEVVNSDFIGNTAESGGAAMIVSVAPVAIRDSIFRENTATLDGGCVYVNGFGAISLITNNFQNNTARRAGGALSSEGTLTLTVDTCTFVNNTAPQGGSAFFGGKTIINMLGSTVQNNSAVNGGGICVDDSSNVTFTNCQIRLNTASANGGAISQGGTAVSYIRNSIVELNQAYFQGGAIRIDSKTSIAVVDSQIRLNSVTSGFGGAISISSVSTLLLERSQVNQNKAISGAGLYTNEFSNSVLRDSLFFNNQAQQFGGAIYCVSGTLVSQGTMNYRNNSATAGGALSADVDCGFTSSRQVFSSNTARVNGGAVYSNKGRLNFASCNFTDNMAQGGGGAFYYELFADGSGFPVVCNSTINLSNRASYGNYAATGPFQLVLAEGTASQQTIYTDEEVTFIIQVNDKEGNQIRSFDPSLIITLTVQPQNPLLALPDVIGISKLELNKQRQAASFTFKMIGVPRQNYTLLFDAGTFVKLSHQVTILPCRIGEQPETVGVNKTFCRKCPAGTFRLIPPEQVKNENDERCQSCLRGAVCDGGTVILMQTGFWRPDNMTTNVYSCPRTCLQDIKVNGSVVSRCREGHYGPMCMLCEKGFTRTKNECKKCPEPVWTYIGAAASVIFTIVFCFFLFTNPASKNKSSSNALRKAIVRHIQVLYMLDTAFSIPYPNAWTQEIAEKTTAAVTIDIKNITFADCVFNTNLTFYFKYFIYMAIPPAFILCQVLIYVAHLTYWSLVLKSYAKARSRLTVMRRLAFKNIILILIMTFPSIAIQTFEFFHYVDIYSGTTLIAKYLAADFSIKFEDISYKALIWFNCLMILLYPLGIPLLFAGILFYYRKRRHLVMVNDKIGLLFSAYKYKFFFWDLFEMVRLLVLALLASYVSSTPQQTGACVVLIIALLIHSSAQPYQFAIVNRAVAASYCVLFTTVFVALLLGIFDCDAYKNTQQFDEAVYNNSDLKRAFDWCTNYRSAMITFIFVLNCVYLGIVGIIASWAKIRDLQKFGLKRTLHVYSCGILFRSHFEAERKVVLQHREKAKATEESLYGTEMSSTFGGDKSDAVKTQEVQSKRIANPFNLSITDSPTPISPVTPKWK